MPTRETVSSICVSVERVPTDVKKELLYKIAERLQLQDSEILVEEVPGYHNEKGLGRYVFLVQNEKSKCSNISNLLKLI